MGRVLRRIVRGQRGFTLIELIIGLAVSSLIGLFLMMTTGQAITINTSTMNRTVVEAQVQNVGEWFGKDIRMAETVTAGGTNGFPVTMTYQEYDGTSHQIQYKQMSGVMKRYHSIDGGTEVETLVAQHLDPAPTTFQAIGSFYDLAVQASYGSGTEVETEARDFRLWSRYSMGG